MPALMVFLLPALLHAVTPEAVMFRGQLLDSGQPAPDGTYRLRFELRDAPAGGNLLSSVALHDVTVTGGQFVEDIGALFPVSTADAYLIIGVEMPDQSVDTMPPIRITAVPYAVRAGTAEYAEHVEWANVQNAPAPVAGPTGPMGPPGASVVPEDVLAGDAVCPTGGSRFLVDGTVTYACNGDVGAAGESVDVEVLQPGDDPVCPDGGSRFVVGSIVSYACHGARGAAGPQGPAGPTGLIASGSATGVTPYWNGSAWVVNSTNVFNNGGNVGVGTVSPPTKLAIVDNTLSGCSFCRRWADSNGRVSAAWNCTGLDVANQLDFTGDVDSTDDLDLAVVCPAAAAANFQLCRRYADGDARVMAPFSCVDFRTAVPTVGADCATAGVLCTDFLGDVDLADDFDVLIKTKTAGFSTPTPCGIGVRYADANGRASAAWRYAPIGHVLRTDFLNDVDGNDDLDFMLTCAIPYEDE